MYVDAKTQSTMSSVWRGGRDGLKEKLKKNGEKFLGGLESNGSESI